MKKIWLPLLLLFVSIISQAQRKPISYEELIRRSDKARTGGFVMAGTGVLFAAGGAAIILTGANKDGDQYSTDEGLLSDKEFLIIGGSIVSLVGIGLGAGSLGLFARSAKLKKRAEKLKLNAGFLPVMMPTTNAYAFRRVPQAAITLSIPLGN